MSLGEVPFFDFIKKLFVPWIFWLYNLKETNWGSY